MSIIDNIENIEHILGDLEAFRYGDKVFMTGQEWYDRFEKELYKPKEQEFAPGTFADDEKRARFYREGGTNFMYDQAIKAAKKASGL